MTYYEDEEDYGDELPPASGKGIRVEIDANALGNIAQIAANTLQAKLNKLAEKMVRDQIDAVIDEAWRNKISAMADAAIHDYLTKPRSKTNQYGETIGGGTITISDKIPDAVKAYMDESVDSEGRPSNSYSSSSKTKRLDWIVAKMVIKEINAETSKAAAAVTEKARQVVTQHVARFISEQMVPAIEVNPK